MTNKPFDSSGLHTPQIAHAQKLIASLESNNIAWDGSSTGCGKTYSASAVLRHFNKPFVVICPKLVIPTWEKVLDSFGLKAKFIINYEKLCRGGTKWLKFKRLKKDVDKMDLIKLKIPKEYIVVLDESHKCRGVTTIQAGLLMALKREDYQSLLLSATQATSPLDMRAFGFAVNLHKGGMKDYKTFCIDAGAEWKGHHGAMLFDDENQEAREKMKQVHHNLFDFQKIGARLDRHDFKGIFRPTQIVAEAYDMGINSDKIQQAYDTMEYELDALEERTSGYKDHILAIITRMRRKVELLKVPTMHEMASEFYTEGKSTLLFVNYTDTIEALYQRLCEEFGPDKVGRIYGEQTQNQKLADVAAFQADKKRFIVANLLAGGQSINCHDLNGNHPRSALINPSFSAIAVLQSMGRHDRANAMTDTYTRFVYSAKCHVEENVCRKFQFKKDNIELLNDGDLTPERLFQFAGMDL